MPRVPETYLVCTYLVRRGRGGFRAKQGPTRASGVVYEFPISGDLPRPIRASEVFRLEGKWSIMLGLLEAGSGPNIEGKLISTWLRNKLRPA